ncbi:MAG: hypothetical protein ABI874_06620 [Chloroflexota bacterium]
MNDQQTKQRFSRWMPALAGLGALALLVLVFTFPPAQAAAQGFLDLFRVRRFAAITVDPARMQQIANSKIDVESLISKNVEVVKKAAEPQAVSNAAAASQAAGFAVKTPRQLPAGMTLVETLVQGESIVRVTADTAVLQALLDTLNIKDIKAPAKLNGAVVTLRKPAMVMMRYKTSSNATVLMQAHSPEVALPAGVSMADLGEIGLRIVGLNASEARQFAQTIDWNTTVLVPVPANAASFREVSVRNTKGLLITTGGTGGSSVRSPDGARQQSLLLWSEGDMVFAVDGGFAGADLIEFANSLN